MNNIVFLSTLGNNSTQGFNFKESEKSRLANHAYLKQVIHEKHIDEFFNTNVDAPPKRTSWLAVFGSLVGVILPTLLIAKRQGKIDSYKQVMKSLNIKHDINSILTIGLGGVAGGLLGGLLDKKEKDKLNKMEETTFQVMNITLPALLVDKSIKFCEKTKALNNSPTKLLFTALSIVVGAGAAVKISNKLDDKFFDKYNRDPERKFKKKDIIVHFDDILGALIIAKIPIAEKLHINKILPAIYAWSGYHVGDS